MVLFLHLHPDKGEFLKLADLLNVEVSEVVDRTTFMGHYFPKIYFSTPSKILRTIVKHKYTSFNILLHRVDCDDS